MAMSSPAVGRGTPPTVSASAIVAEAVEGSHVLKIEGYSRTKGLGNGESILSDSFTVGGHSWCIQYYPDGADSDSADWISMFLQLVDYVTDVRAQFNLWLLDRTGEPGPPHWSRDTTVQTYTRVDSWGFKKFIKRKDLEESTWLVDDCFRVRYDIAVSMEFRREPTRQFVVAPPPDMLRHLGRLLSSEQGADVRFQVAGETFAAHKNILAARSSVFSAELFGPMKEATGSHIRVDDMEARVFKAMLWFIYTDTLPEIESGDMLVMAQHLLVAADRYSLERLKLICEEKLCNYIDMSTAATTLALAEQHGCHGLREACFEFLKSPSNLRAVVAGEGFDHLASSCPSPMKELLAKVAR
ncbi:hypothetical protein ACP4OV_001912 [Aristida adscensionis]